MIIKMLFKISCLVCLVCVIPSSDIPETFHYYLPQVAITGDNRLLGAWWPSSKTHQLSWLNTHCYYNINSYSQQDPCMVMIRTPAHWHTIQGSFSYNIADVYIINNEPFTPEPAGTNLGIQASIDFACEVKQAITAVNQDAIIVTPNGIDLDGVIMILSGIKEQCGLKNIQPGIHIYGSFNNSPNDRIDYFNQNSNLNLVGIWVTEYGHNNPIVVEEWTRQLRTNSNVIRYGIYYGGHCCELFRDNMATPLLHAVNKGNRQ